MYKMRGLISEFAQDLQKGLINGWNHGIISLSYVIGGFDYVT